MAANSSWKISVKKLASKSNRFEKLELSACWLHLEASLIIRSKMLNAERHADLTRNRHLCPLDNSFREVL